MAETIAGRDDDAAEPIEPDAGPAVPRALLTGRDLIEALVERARVRIRWIGAGRLAGAAGATLVLAGLGWWLLRSPVLPTEAALPVAATHTAAPPASGAPTTADAAVAASTAVPTTGPDVVLVHVAGAVHTPGVYELRPGQRVSDAVAAAGGATSDADPNALNLAAPVADGDRVEVPEVGAIAVVAAGDGHTSASGQPAGESGVAAGPLDVNAATAGELEQLPGIGPATASAIVAHRTENGPFPAVDDLLDVAGIGPAKLDAIRELVTT